MYVKMLIVLMVKSASKDNVVNLNVPQLHVLKVNDVEFKDAKTIHVLILLANLKNFVDKESVSQVVL
jgi:hypothetical protein